MHANKSFLSYLAAIASVSFATTVVGGAAEHHIERHTLPTRKTVDATFDVIVRNVHAGNQEVVGDTLREILTSITSGHWQRLGRAHAAFSTTELVWDYMLQLCKAGEQNNPLFEDGMKDLLRIISYTKLFYVHDSKNLILYLT